MLCRLLSALLPLPSCSSPASLCCVLAGGTLGDAALSQVTVDKKDLDADVSKAKHVKTREQELAERQQVLAPAQTSAFIAASCVHKTVLCARVPRV